MSYAELEARHRRLSHLSHVEAIAGWDEAAMMPQGGGEARAEALATLRVLMHEQATDDAMGDLLGAAEAEASAGRLSPWQAANLREMKRGWIRETCLPADLVQATSRAESRSEQAWRKLRGENDWEGFRPLLQEVLARKRDVAAALGDRLKLGRYDALLDGYEPGARAGAIAVLFAELRDVLPPLIAAAVERQASEPLIPIPGPFPIERQRWLGIELMKRAGFDFQHGRLDVSHHPFCGGVPRDVRITTRYDEADFTKSLMGVLHETGHAKYEQGLPEAWLDQPVGRARSMSIHESQSLFQEMQVSRGGAFLKFSAALVAEAFPEAAAAHPAAFSPKNLERLYTRVRPDFIRVDADEATYPCHIILRFEIEQALVSGGMEVAHIPEAWDAGMQALLGLRTEGNFKNGCMQDVHWPAGLFGYFPTYTMGALTAAQLFESVQVAIPDVPHLIAAGDFSSLNAWLRDRIWARGSYLSTDDLLREATGQTLSASAFKRHLSRRYLGANVVVS